MFFFKKSKIVIDMFTTLRSVYELYKPDTSIKFYPDEFKSIPNTYVGTDPTPMIRVDGSTIRKCNGIIDYYKTGFVIPMWTDFICQPKSFVAKESSIALVGLPFFYDSNPRDQYPGLFEDYIHIKLDSPWLFRENSGVRFVWGSATWNLHKHRNNFIVLPAAVSYNYQCATNVNMFVRKDSENFTLTSGTPLVHITPVSEKEIIIKHHLIDETEKSKIGIPQEYSAIRTERYSRWVKELSKNEKKCPFGFGR